MKATKEVANKQAPKELVLQTSKPAPASTSRPAPKSSRRNPSGNSGNITTGAPAQGLPSPTLPPIPVTPPPAITTTPQQPTDNPQVEH